MLFTHHGSHVIAADIQLQTLLQYRLMSGLKNTRYSMVMTFTPIASGQPHGDEPGTAVVEQRDTWVHVYEDAQKEVGLDINAHTDTVLTHLSPGHQTKEYILHQDP